MRIRKRKIPFPLSSLSPVPLSDPHLSRSSSDQLQLLHNNPHHNFSPQDAKASFFDSQSFDEPNYPIGGLPNAQDYSHGSWKQEEKKVLMQDGEVKGGEGVVKSNDTRERSFLGAKTSTPFHQDGRWKWCEGEKAFPAKKRKASFETRSNEETLMEKGKKMKTKMNNECMQRCNEEIEEVGDEETKGDDDQRSSSTAKKRVRRGALMEGSRCSRVNGRGWRCCQQTLVGYSLCEHHLGKGRLRSMTSVRSRSMAKTSTTKRETQPLLSSTLPLPREEAKGISFGDKVIDSVNGDAEVIKKPLMTSKKKQKLGMAKARSINSLLGQSKNATEASQTR
ncbi:uncharacterized protein LOC110620726 [Manihot esculenta]|uniref:WRC domain-containing protein n=1 Tax=Manihot esculenta TaxID=3983 RepID=A0A2C9VEL8_MANES|nr:uncharacterized protein LOC110620726 [Manihot esculenta]OAY43113.1 hypothetical protein MANES_08G043600v8 [Manihot esculenta]